MSTIGRLTRRSDFLAAAGGRRYHNERLSAQGLVRAEPAAGDDPPEGLRIGFTITKRVGHATERNRIRRRLRAAVAEAAGALPARDADVVLVARRPALHAPFQTLIDDLRQAVAVVTKPQAAKTAAGSGPGHRGEPDRASSRRRRGKGAPASGASAAAPVLATGATASVSPGPRPAPAGAPSPPSNACDGPTDG
ncbi:ribonuclease P protein component [Methylobacterium sp. J-078]|uniref:ribonuclease P protein component n=1 Tax=Methylobacterium sp. J-078 TaxID=2836657 RepID=UPI001FB8677E|nr:ribonuclease P protein component [Methylobacterium sp. J-078]MCJ2045765.1 ribonuclease P protein component [Methylobacterium sp. J-078]